MIDVGRLNKRVTFKKPTETTNKYNQTVQGLEDFKTVWASVEPTRSEEMQDAERVKNIMYYTVFVRYNPLITPDMIIDYKGRKLEIIAFPVNVMEKNELLKIYCTYRDGETV